MPFLVDFERNWHLRRKVGGIEDTFREQTMIKIARLLEIHQKLHPTDAELAERDNLQIRIQFHSSDLDVRAFHLAEVINGTLDNPAVPVTEMSWNHGSVGFINNRHTSHCRPGNAYSARRYNKSQGALYSLLV